MASRKVSYFTVMVAMGLLGIGLVNLNLTGLNFTFYPGDLVDARFNAYILEHGFQYLTGQNDTYWNAPFMWPEKEVISYSDNLLGSVPIYAAFRILEFDVLTSYQLWFLLVFFLNYLSCYVFLKWVFSNPYAAIAGALVFAFSIALQSQMAHAQAFSRFFIPLAFLFLLKFGKEWKPGYFFLSILCLTAQFYTAIYLGFLTMTSLAVGFVVVAFFGHRTLAIQLRNVWWWLKMLAFTALNAGLLYVLFDPYIRRSGGMVAPNFDAILYTIPELKSFVYSKVGSLSWAALEHTLWLKIPAYYDHEIFPGGLVLLGSLVLCIYLITRWKMASSDIKILSITGLLTFFLFLRIDDWTAYKLLFEIPGYGAMRALHRIIGVLLLFGGIAVSFFYDQVSKRINLNRFLMILIFIAFFATDNYVYSENTYRTKKSEAQNRVHRIATKIKHLPKGSLISYEPDTFDIAAACQLDAMLASQRFGFRCINGYTATSKLEFTPFWTHLTEQGRIYWLKSNLPSDQIPYVFVVK